MKFRLAHLFALILLLPISLRAQDQSKTFHPFSFALLSDLHLAEQGGVPRLEKALAMIADRHDIAFVIVEGDIIWPKDFELLKPILAEAGVPVHLVYGNNHWKSVKDGSIERAFGGEWKHNDTELLVTPSCCWNFVSRSKKVRSSFMRIMKIEKDSITSELLPVHLEGEISAA